MVLVLKMLLEPHDVWMEDPSHNIALPKFHAVITGVIWIQRYLLQNYH